MPLPLLIPIAIGVAGAFGVGKAVVAAVESSDASDIDSRARRIKLNADDLLNNARNKVNHELSILGRSKMAALKITLSNFVDVYSKIKNVELIGGEVLAGLTINDFDENALNEIKNDISMIENAALGLGGGAVGGALIAFGAYNGTMLLASAGTGTAIASLSGVAATNATLAWLGGGTLAAGGLGVAGGAVVLGVLVAGPALLLFGSILGARASEKLSNAKANQETAEMYAEQCDAIIEKLNGIAGLASLAKEALSKARTSCRRSVTALDAVISASGTDYRSYSAAEKDVVFRTVKLAQLVKALVDTPILNEDGEILGSAQSRIASIQDAMSG